MARGKNLTFKMKKYVDKRLKLDPDDWVYTKNTPEILVITNKDTKEELSINKIERNITSF